MRQPARLGSEFPISCGNFLSFAHPSDKLISHLRNGTLRISRRSLACLRNSMKWIFRELSRLAMAGLFIILGIGLCWRALNYSSPVDTTLLAPLLCVILAIVLTM